MVLLRDHAPTILICGEAGVGKSSLINAIFGRNLAKTGAGGSVTAKCEFFPATDDSFVNLWDTRGFSNERTADEDYIADHLRQHSEIDVLWWLTRDRTNPPQLASLRARVEASRNGVPLRTVVVITKCDTLSEAQIQAVEQSFLKYPATATLPIVRTACRDPKEAVVLVVPPVCPMCGCDDISANMKQKSWKCNLCREQGSVPPGRFGLLELSKATDKLLGELEDDLKEKAFKQAQRIDVDSKTPAAIAYVITAVLAAGMQ
jgi:GTP-binding protein EngB required for normal cell division